MRLSLLLALRHLSDPRRSRALTMTGLVAAGGICVGVLALTVFLSVMNGMERELASLIQDGEAHVELRPGGAGAIARAAPVLDLVAAQPGVAAAAPFVRSELLLARRGPDGRRRMETATITGIDPAREARATEILGWIEPRFSGFSPAEGWILEGDAGPLPGIVLGIELAKELGAGLGDRVRLVVPDAATARAGALDSLRGRETWRHVVGLVDGRLYEFNATRVFGDLESTAAFLHVDGEAQGVAVRCDDPEAAGRVAGALLALPELAGWRAETWQDRNRVLFEAMGREKALMYLFLLLTVAVASLGIVGAMTLMVSEKRAEIGILRTLGMSRRAVMGVIVLEGWLVGLSGVAAGMLGGLGLGSWLQRHPLRIPWDLFIMDTVPVVLNPVDFLWVGSLTLGVCLLATLYPGWEAARMDPIQAIRSV